MVSTISLQNSSPFLMDDYIDSSDSSVCHSPITPTSGYQSDASEDLTTKSDAGIQSDEPKFTYATLIAQAIMSTPEQKMLLQDIYSYITTKYEYYRTCNKQWQNSIRHNLSLHKAFCKLPRQKGTPGKGNFWTLTDEYKKFYVDDELHIPKGYELVKDGGKSRGKGKVTKASLRSQASPYSKPMEESSLPSPPSSKVNFINKSPTLLSTPKANRDLLPTPDSTPNGFSYNLDDTPTPARIKRINISELAEGHPIEQQTLFPDIGLYNFDLYQQLCNTPVMSASVYHNMLYSALNETNKTMPSDMGIAPELLMGPSNQLYSQNTESFDVDSFLNFE
ncbi:transcription factor [Basidiobolus ranarum]|uniref:Transcription factor n=1 Tax=Basidiobolus ranarum TaxID=34480 RepID=A0ABR2WT84_9FUNG